MTRLIDADALIEELKDSIYKTWFGGDEFESGNQFGIEWAIERVKSAPTVETTDDVLERLPKFSTFSIRFDGLDWKLETPYGNYSGNTPYEAVKKLEASINAK